MIKIVVVSDKAAIEIKDAANWYEKQSPGLSKRFIEELDHSFSKIQKMPFAYKVVSKGIHRYLLKVFPYIVFFAIIDSKVVILRVRHKKQKQLKRYT